MLRGRLRRGQGLVPAPGPRRPIPFLLDALYTPCNSPNPNVIMLHLKCITAEFSQRSFSTGDASRHALIVNNGGTSPCIRRLWPKSSCIWYDLSRSSYYSSRASGLREGQDLRSRRMGLILGGCRMGWSAVSEAPGSTLALISYPQRYRLSPSPHRSCRCFLLSMEAATNWL